MRCIPSKTFAFLIICSFFASSLALAQQERREEVRPRRTQTPPENNRTQSEAKDPSAVPTVPKAEASQPSAPQWNVVDRSVTQVGKLISATNGPEPIMRIALATDVRAATVSTNAGLMSATDLAQTLVPLDVSRVRVEAHLLSPLPAVNENFRLRIAGLATRAQADTQAKLIREATTEQSQVFIDAETETWGLLVGPRRSRESAELAQEQLENAGFSAIVIDLTPLGSTGSTTQLSTVNSRTPGANPSKAAPAELRKTAGSGPAITNAKSPSVTGNPNVRLASRASFPTRELVASTANSAKLFSSSAPVLFASGDEAKAPMRFNDRPYRGRIEVFANTRGLLTVVNVIGLEDYVRGVVANELSPGGYPALEALKAQAIAARTYALKNRGQFISQGFDLLPTTRSQVYRGLASEQPLSTRAVDETRGMVATYDGQPINALYTSTCGGRTEDAANIFNEAVPYLRARECSVEGKAGLAPFTIKSTREPAEFREEHHVPLARLAAMLSVQGFGTLPTRISDSWLSSPVTLNEVRAWLGSVAGLAHQTVSAPLEDVNRPAAFATALSAVTFGESRADTLLNNADVEYFLAIRDAGEVPAVNRADVALMVRDGYLSVFPDVTLRPRETMTRGRVVRAIGRLLENRGLLQLQKGTARPAADGTVILRSTKGKDQPIRVSPDVYLFRQFGDSVYPVRSVILVGGEPITFHLNSSGAVDYLEVRPAPNGAAADRFSPFSNWTIELSRGEVKARLGRAAQGIGSLIDLRVVTRGGSRRATDLEVTGTEGIAHVRGGRIRSALGLREQLFVIDKKYDDEGRVAAFVFAGRGWGHGVGMCQVGAYGLARHGLSYEKILKAYYSGIQVTKLY